MGRRVRISYVDRGGKEVHTDGFLTSVDYRPMYGTVLTVDDREICLEKVRAIVVKEEKVA
ncbi:MAG: hypothetical protein C4342_02955 [Armatimonadota bacterium]